MVKILGIVGSHREDSNTRKLVELALDEASKLGCETEMLELHDKRIEYCTACWKCREQGECWIEDDMRWIQEKLLEADGIIVGSPVYFGGISGKLKAFFDRTLPLRAWREQRFRLRNKVGGAIATGGFRHGGQEYAIRDIHAWMLIHAMIVVSDDAPTAHFGGVSTGKAEEDELGQRTARALGKRVGEVALALKKASFL